MKLSEALMILRSPARPGAEPFRLALCTGFTPLHLETFLAAHLRNALKDRGVKITTGVFGDLAGTLESAAATESIAAIAAVLEWADLDPRLGVRRLGGWSYRNFDDVVEGCRASLRRLAGELRKCAESKPVVIALPSLPMVMIGMNVAWEESTLRLRLNALLDQFALETGELKNVRLVSRQELDMRSPLTRRLDLQSELHAGYPYTNGHADILAEHMARLLAPPVAKKGIITDLDNTLWAGILGDDGVEGIAWTLDEHAQLHGLYQQLLVSLADTGVLVAIASKNELSNVEMALDRPDIVLRKSTVFPVAAGWGAKSDAVREILKAWNVGSDAVVFVDDSPLEIAEVKTAYPDMECLQFSSENPDSVWGLFTQLRNTFGKHQVSDEDRFRAQSLKNSVAFSAAEGAPGTLERFLESIEPMVEFSFEKDPPDPRALELLNKTNQFNLNGYRFTDADWNAYLRQPETFVMVVSYRDKFGPLGKIAVTTGRKVERKLILDRWVMSCRAFSRRIEVSTLQKLFETFGAEEIKFDFVATAKNAPLQKYFRQLTGQDIQPGHRLNRAQFTEICPKTNSIPQEI